MEFKKPVAAAKSPGGVAREEEYYGIRILRDGTWLHQGRPITRHNMVKLFASALKKDAGGDYWLVTPFERGRIEVEDAPFLAVELEVSSSGKYQVLRFRTNLDDWVTASSDHPVRVSHHRRTGEPSPYIMVRENMEARISRAVYYELAALGVADEADGNVLGVWSAGSFFALGPAK